MATYFHGNSEIQGGGGSGGDGLQTLILMNPSYVGYSDAQPPGNLVFLNSSSSSGGIHHAPPHSLGQHFVGIPLQGAADAHLQQQAAPPGFIPRVHYNLCNMPVDLGAARDAARSHQKQQGLSLSLSSQQPPGYRDATPQPTSLPANDIRASLSPASGVLLGSKYLKAAQELLDEVVNVGSKGAKIPNNIPGDPTQTAAINDDAKTEEDGGSNSKRTAERQEIQMKKAKLINMLDEVEQRYRQYHNQMQMVISWFEQAAGIRSAKTYTALALQTISKQFRCLKDVIMSQIRTASKNLGEADAPEGKIEGSRLKYVDTQIRQQRALQQLGMIQHNAWRPQRGLPERSVSVLRAWLFEHFLHPYPKDSDKLMLAKQTGLTRSQVSNWFINARVRLWKPMVEEMYLEEMKEHGKAGSDDKLNRPEHSGDQPNPTKKSVSMSQTNTPGTDQGFMTKQDNNMNQSNAPAMPMSSTAMRNLASFNFVGSSDIESITQGSPKKMRSAEILHSMNMDNKTSDDNNEHMSMKFSNDRPPGRDGFTLMGAPTNFIGGFGSYFTGAEQFQAPYPGNGGVSLTLGLPHCDNLAMPASHQSFLPHQAMQLGRGVELGEANDFTTITPPTTNVYDSINIQNRKSFAAQLLPDFVA